MYLHTYIIINRYHQYNYVHHYKECQWASYKDKFYVVLEDKENECVFDDLFFNRTHKIIPITIANSNSIANTAIVPDTVRRLQKLPRTGTGTAVPVRFRAVEMRKEAVPVRFLKYHVEPEWEPLKY